jgi:N-acetylglutamate synthase-like GNAT family acetyltransferase
MSLQWIHENPPHWDAGKAAVIGGAGAGIFDFPKHASGDLIPGDWWRVERDGVVLGYGWMDTTWGDAEILLAVGGAARGGGVGSFILDRLEEEAAARGLNYLYNVVRPTHPDRDGITAWLEKRGFKESTEGDRALLKRKVHRAEA